MPASADFSAFLAAFLSSLALRFSLFACSRWRFACVCGLCLAMMNSFLHEEWHMTITAPIVTMPNLQRRDNRCLQDHWMLTKSADSDE